MMSIQKGFTLLEMSVVLVLISLIIGGIFVGENIIRSSQLRSVVSEAHQYTQTIADFKDKYQALPGDFANAQGFFGASGGCPTVGSSGTCNGDGNGRITDQNPGDTDSAEQFLAWHHLYLAKMIDQYVSGNAGSAGSFDRIPRVNIPSSRLSGAGWGMITLTASDILSGGVIYLRYKTGDIPPNTVLWIGARSTSGTDNRQNPIFTTAEAAQLDAKVDDGWPVVGRVVAQYGVTGANCYLGSSATSSYLISATGQVCALVFKTGH